MEHRVGICLKVLVGTSWTVGLHFSKHVGLRYLRKFTKTCFCLDKTKGSGDQKTGLNISAGAKKIENHIHLLRIDQETMVGGSRVSCPPPTDAMGLRVSPPPDAMGSRYDQNKRPTPEQATHEHQELAVIT